MKIGSKGPLQRQIPLIGEITMTHNASIIVLDNIVTTRMRIKKMMDKQSVNVLEASNVFEFFSILTDNINSVKLIILNVDIGSVEGLEILRRLKSKNATIPVVILTNNGNRNIFAKAIVEGVADYILKPFEDDFLESRLNKLLEKNDERENQDLFKYNHYHFINTEIKKAKKGSYIFSTGLTTFFTPLIQFTPDLDVEYSKFSDPIYNRLKSLVGDTDSFIKFGSQSFLGFFPFCSENDTILLNEKLQVRFGEMKASNLEYQRLYLVNAFVMFPQDGMSTEELLNKMIIKTNLKIRMIKDDLQRNQ